MTPPVLTGRVGAPAGLVPVFCVIDDAHRDLSVADAACNGRFRHAGATLDVGIRPDWLRCGLAHDEEWRIEFAKLYEGLDLAHAFGCTGELRHLDTWTSLVESFVDQVPVGTDTSDVSARRIQNWLYAAERFATADAFDGFGAGFDEMFRRRVEADVDHLRTNLTAERNHRTLEIHALLLADLALGRFDRAADDLLLLADNAATDIWDDGVQRECSSDYHLIVLRSFVSAIVNARRVGLAVPPDLLDRADRAATFARWLHRPDGTTPALSDGDQGDFRPLLELAADVLDRPDLAWVATAGRTGTAPTERTATFADSGYLFWRSGWSDPHESWGVFDCGPIGDGGHGHYDQLSVELAEGQRPLVVDPGRFTYAHGPDGWRHWFKGTAAHNTLCVDGLDHVPFRKGKPKGELSQATLLARTSLPGLDVATGSVTSPCHDALHTRTVAHVRGRYWLVRDVAAAPTPHRYEVRWHLDTRCQGAVTVEQDGPDAGGSATWRVEGPDVRLTIVASEHAEVVLEDGWVSPTYGTRLPAPVVVVRLDATCDADVVTMVSGASGPTDLVVRPIRGGVAMRIADAEGVDSVGWDDGLHAPHHGRTLR